MPRDATELEYASEPFAAATAAAETVPACYLCGAWADDARRCRHPGSTACIQASARFAVAPQPAVPTHRPMSTPLTRH